MRHTPSLVVVLHNRHHFHSRGANGDRIRSIIATDEPDPPERRLVLPFFSPKRLRSTESTPRLCDNWSEFIEEDLLTLQSNTRQIRPNHCQFLA